MVLFKVYSNPIGSGDDSFSPMLNDNDEERFDGNIDSQHHPFHSMIAKYDSSNDLIFIIAVNQELHQFSPSTIEVGVFDILGNLILTQTTFSDGGSIDLSSLAAGVYFVQSEALQHTVKITIAK